MNNRYFNNGCPPLMQDGRFITTYYDKRFLDQEIRKINNIDNAYTYKCFLQNNAHKIIDNERNYIIKSNTCDVNCCTPLSYL